MRKRAVVSSSSAFPPGLLMPELQASVHERDLYDITSDQIHYRTSVLDSDMNEIRQLHAEWLPVDYNDEFYMAMTEKDSDVLSVLACYQSSIVGMATIAVRKKEARYNFSCDLLPHLGLDTGSESIAYILTLGVVDELRRTGVASALLEEALKRISISDPHCRVVFLHVIDYNEPAMRLYRKHGFTEFKEEPNFYKIVDSWYSGILFYKELSKPRSSWVPPWVKQIVGSASKHQIHS